MGVEWGGWIMGVEWGGWIMGVEWGGVDHWDGVGRGGLWEWRGKGWIMGVEWGGVDHGSGVGRVDHGSGVGRGGSWEWSGEGWIMGVDHGSGVERGGVDHGDGGYLCVVQLITRYLLGSPFNADRQVLGHVTTFNGLNTDTLKLFRKLIQTIVTCGADNILAR